MQSLQGDPKKQVLIELRKKINQLIAAQEMEDPEAAADGQDQADQAMDGTDSVDEQAAEPTDEGDGLVEGTPGDEESDLHQRMRDYMNPKPKDRRPGTAMMIAVEKKMPAKNKGQFGKLPRRDAV